MNFIVEAIKTQLQEIKDTGQHPTKLFINEQTIKKLKNVELGVNLIPINWIDGWFRIETEENCGWKRSYLKESLSIERINVVD